MVRWAPDAKGRLQSSALELFTTFSFAEVTVQQIADHAGVSQRTFFRYFATKEDVLFADGEEILATIVEAVETASDELSLIAMFTEVCGALDTLFGDERKKHHQRMAVIMSEPALIERDLLKQITWVDAITRLLVARGFSRERARIVVSVAFAVIRDVYLQWARDRRRNTLTDRWNAALTGLLADLRS